MYLPFPETYKELDKASIPFRTDVNLSKNCSFRIGGLSPLFVEPENQNQIFDSLSIFSRLDIPFKILGGGTNLLISDHPDNFAVIRLAGEFKEFASISDNQFSIGAGALTTPTFRKLSLLGFTGAEFLSTIPGSVGGAVIQNAGCYGGEFFDLINFVECIENGKIKRLSKKNIQFGYRTTQFLQNKDALVLKIELSLKHGKIDEIGESLKEKRDKRNSSQPSNKKSAGSVFKNPSTARENPGSLKSWELIDKAGLRGIAKGDAIISPEHCNFITNQGNAKAADVHYLIRLVQETVFKKFGILLEREIEYFGDIP